jgi:hypothetical protein
VVQEFPSSQSVPSERLLFLHPPRVVGVSCTQESRVHGFWSSQLRTPWRQVPVAVSHESTVQGFRSSHDGHTASGEISAIGPDGTSAVMSRSRIRSRTRRGKRLFRGVSTVAFIQSTSSERIARRVVLGGIVSQRNTHPIVLSTENRGAGNRQDPSRNLSRLRLLSGRKEGIFLHWKGKVSLDSGQEL